MSSMFVRRSLLIGTVAFMTGLAGCASKVRATTDYNPPPAEAFSAFGRIELQGVRAKEGMSIDAAGVAKIDENLRLNLAASLKQWNAGAGNGRLLVIDPVVEQMDFKHGAGRVLLGPLAGGSGVFVRLNIKDAAGKVIATPEFVQRTGAWSGGMTLGVMDNLMLTRVAGLASEYLQENYSQARGGRTGANDAPPKAP